jgi:hypothetical protein
LFCNKLALVAAFIFTLGIIIGRMLHCALVYILDWYTT